MSALFKDRIEKRKVSETLDSVLLPLTLHMKDEDAAYLKRAMEIIHETGTLKDTDNDR